jgi:hypothetical protein
MARSEAVNRSVNVWVTFLPGAAAADADGYRVWVDDWDAVAAAPGSDNTYTDGSDTLIRDVLFPREVQFYDRNATDGPNVRPEGGALNVEDGVGDDDNGIVFDSGSGANDADEVAFVSRGTVINSDGNALVNTGYVYIYFPASATDHVTMRSAPYALVVTSGTGSVRISRWDKTNAAWSRK